MCVRQRGAVICWSLVGGGARLPGVPRWCVMAGVCGRWGTCCQSDSALSSRHIMSNAWDASCVTADLPVCPAYMHSSPECVCMSMCACVVLVVFAKKTTAQAALCRWVCNRFTSVSAGFFTRI